ncbi:MAG: Lrp/AsnC family transcriptional regulator, partial [Pseudomonadota bacterium]|nr:Lrp/AsnC family transcriptional regulator [Pseudomonadota bacterium]
LDPAKLNVGVTVFVALKTSEHSQDWLETFAGHVNSIDEVVEFYRMSGDVDYMLRVVVPDIAAYDEVYKRLIAVGGLSDVSSSFAMERIKYTTELPLDYAE